MNQDQQMQLWAMQAMKAIDLGADPLKVNEMLKGLVDKAGYTGVIAPIVPTGTKDEELVKAIRDLWSVPSEGQKKAEKEYESIVTPSVLEELNKLPHSPHLAWVKYGLEDLSPESIEELYDREARRGSIPSLTDEELSAAEKERKQAQKGLLELVRDSLKVGTARGTQGLLRLIPTEWTQNTADSLKDAIERTAFDPSMDGEWDIETGEWKPNNARRALSMAGEMGGTLLPMAVPGAGSLYGLGLLGLGQGVHVGESLLDRGASPLQASLYGGITAASWPILGRIAPSFGSNITTRTATGAGVNTGLGIGLDASLNAVAPEDMQADLLDPWTRIPDAVLGGTIGAASRAPRKPSPLDVTLDNIPDPPFVEVFSPDTAQLDLFGGEPVPADRIVARRIAEQKAAEEGRTRTEERQAELEREYAFQQQDRVMGSSFPEEVPGDLFSVDRPAPSKTAPEQPRTALGDALSEAGVSPEMFRDLPERPPQQLSLGREMNHPSLVPEVPGPVLEGQPAPSPAVKEASKNSKMSEKAQARRNEEVAEIRSLLEKETDPARIGRLQQLLEATENAPDLGALPASVASVVNRAPTALQGKLLEGTLTSKDVLDFYADMPNATAAAEREAVGLVKYLRELSRAIGGEDVGFVVLDRNAHADVLQRNADVLSDGFAAFYDPRTNRIYMNDGVNSGNTMIHEAAHGITARMLYNGENGNLSPRAQAAFNDLHTLYQDIFSPELAKRAKGEERLTYGLSNIHEFYSEFFSNGAFRKSLKDMKLEKGWISKLPEGLQIQLRNAKNMYDVAVKGISGLMARAGITRRTLGMEKEASSAYELMFDRMDSLHRSLSPDERNAMRDASRFNTKQPEYDVSFLGEMVEPRFSPAMAGAESSPASVGDIRLRGKALPQRPSKEPVLVKPRSGASTRFRDFALSSGSRKLLTDATRYRRDQLSGTNYITSTIRNRWFADKSKLDGMQDIIRYALTEPDVRAEALHRIREKSPEMAATLEDGLSRIYSNSLELVGLLEEMPHQTPEIQQLAKTISERADSYLFRGYEARDPALRESYIERLLEQKERGVPAATKKWEDASRYIAARWLPSIKELASTPSSRLDQLYAAHIGVDPPTGMSAVQKRLAIAEAIDGIDNQKQWIDNHLMGILRGEGSGRISRSYDALKDRGGLGTEITEVPPAIASLLGEIDDPILMLMQTLQNQEKQLAHLQSTKNLREQGLEAGYFTERPDTTTHTHRIDDPRLSFLEGLYTTKDIYEALTQMPNIPMWLRKLGNILTMPARVNKVTTILGNVGNIVKDGTGAVAMALNNGVVDPKQYVRGAKAAWHMVGAHMRKSPPSADAEWAMRNGLMEYAQTPELQRRARGVDERDYKRLGSLIEEASGMEDPIGFIQDTVKKTGGKLADAWDVYNSIYSLSELIPKLASAFNERDFWAKQHPEWSQTKLDKFVIDRIRNTTLTPSNVSPILKFTDNVGVSFVARYIASMHKNAIHALGIGLKDMSTGIKEGNSDVFLHGMKRTTGSLVATSIMPMWLYNKFGTDGDRQEYLDSSEITSGVTFRIIEDEDGREYKQDIDRFNAFGPHTQVTYRLVQALAALNNNDKEGAEKHFNIAAQNVFGTMSANSVYRKLDRAFRTGAESNIEKAAPEFFDRIKEIASDNGIDIDNVSSMANLSEIVLPKTFENIIAGLSSDASPRIRAMIAGGFATPFHVDKEIHRYVGRRFNKELGDAKKPFNSLIRSSVRVNKDNLEREFLKSAERMLAPYERVKVAVEAARSQGITDAELYDKLMKSGLNRQAVRMIMTGEELTLPLLFGNIEGTLKADINREADDKIRGRLEDLMGDKLEVLSYLNGKYSGMTIEDLKTGAHKHGR